MAKATLPTNFVDDIMTDAMGNKRRYNLIQNSDGTVSLEDVTDYTQVGSAFGAAEVNATNKAVNESVDKAVVIDNLSDIAANTTSGKVAGALAVKQLNSNMTGELLRTNSGDDQYFDATSVRFIRYKSMLICYIKVSVLKAIRANNNSFFIRGDLSYKYTYDAIVDVINSSTHAEKSRMFIQFIRDSNGVQMLDNVALEPGDVIVGTVVIPDLYLN